MLRFGAVGARALLARSINARSLSARTVVNGGRSVLTIEGLRGTADYIRVGQ
jgi:hypothetical protein